MTGTSRGSPRALARFGAPGSIVNQAKALRPDEFLFFGNPPVRVDVLRRIPGVQFRDAFARRVETEWSGQQVSVIGLGDLISAKRAAGRDRDLRDLKLLERPVGVEAG